MNKMNDLKYIKKYLKQKAQLLSTQSKKIATTLKKKSSNFGSYLKKITIIVVLSSQILIKAYALPAGGPAETWTIGTIIAVGGAIVSAVGSMAANLFLGMQMSLERTMHAVSVATKQEAVNSQQIVNNIQQSSEKFISSVRYQQQSADGLKAWKNYSPQTGQGLNVCKNLSEQQNMLNASVNIDLNIAKHIENLEIDNAAGSVSQNTEELVTNRIKKYNELYCSKEDEAQGKCDSKDPNLANAHLSPDLLFKNVSKDSELDKARVDYIENIMGVPDNYDAQTGSVGAMNYILNKSQKDAFLSIPNYSLNHIRLQNTKQKSGEDSLNTQIQKKVGRYIAGPSATEWNRGLATQSERGLMIELLKMQANQTWLKQKQFEDQLREEATLAALLLLSNKNQEKNLANFSDVTK
jgi:hypothetical protein